MDLNKIIERKLTYSARERGEKVQRVSMAVGEGLHRPVHQGKNDDTL
jgi:hypothetical protein